MTDVNNCPNCGQSPVDNHPEDACVLAALIQVIRERGTSTEATLRAIHANVDIDRFWDDMVEIIDRLEGGDYTDEEKVIDMINGLSREAAIDILDENLGVGCYDEQSDEDVRAEVLDAYKDGDIEVAGILSPI